MFEEFDPQAIDPKASQSMLAELANNTNDGIRKQRAHFRLDIKARVILRPGNSSDLGQFKIQGVTGDISEGGCRLLLPAPCRVGDIYRVEFDRKMLDIPLTFTRCVRCALLREDAFEAGFRFFTPISLPDSIEQDQDSSLL